MFVVASCLVDPASSLAILALVVPSLVGLVAASSLAGPTLVGPSFVIQASTAASFADLVALVAYLVAFVFELHHSS